jgi:PAS domain S-box-containing protein
LSYAIIVFDSLFTPWINVQKEMAKMKENYINQKEILEKLSKLEQQVIQLSKSNKEFIDKNEKLKKENQTLKKELSELKSEERALRESEQMYKLLLKTSPDIVAVSDLEGSITDVSERMLEIFGFDSIDEVLGKNGFELIAPEDRDRMIMSGQKAIEEDFTDIMEYDALRKDGTRFIVEMCGALVRDEQGEPRAFLSTSRDITERKKAEEELKKYCEHLEELVEERTKELDQANAQLREELSRSKKAEQVSKKSEELYRTLVKTSPDSIVVHKLDTTILEVSQRTLELYGYDSAKELIGRDSLELIVPEDREKAKEIHKKIMQQGFVRNMELRMLKKDGTDFIGEINSSLVRDEHGNAKALIGSTRDITDRKQAEEELKRHREELEELVRQRTRELEIANKQLKQELAERKKTEQALEESKEMYKTLLDTSFDGIALHKVNEDAEVIETSAETVKQLGFNSVDDLIGKSGFIAIAPEEHKKAAKIRQKILEKGFVKNEELIFQRKDGTRFFAEINASVIRDSSGKPKVLIGATKDITERKNMERKLKEYSERLEQLLKERTRELKLTQKEVKNLRNKIQKSQRYAEIVGSSAKILSVIDMIDQIAHTNSTVIILGETGSGKDLVARAIHYNSKRKDGPFLSINCAALPEQLIESELFGYVKGAFTGATQDKKGLFEDANKGTIFLNEIGDIPQRLQGKLLDAIENQKIRRLGQSISIDVDVRIIAATNKDLREAVKNGSFRQDLFYRLNVFPIKLPSLRERKEDIPLLAKYFLNKLSSLMEKDAMQISPQAMEVLCNYNYPGNVRELYNIIQRAIIIAEGAILLPEHLPEELKVTSLIPLPDSLADMERRTIEATIQQCNGNLTHAARKLGINRTTLWRKMKKLGL